MQVSFKIQKYMLYYSFRLLIWMLFCISLCLCQMIYCSSNGQGWRLKRGFNATDFTFICIRNLLNEVRFRRHSMINNQSSKIKTFIRYYTVPYFLPIWFGLLPYTHSSHEVDMINWSKIILWRKKKINWINYKG
jgi:hypothetical protein